LSKTASLGSSLGSSIRALWREVAAGPAQAGPWRDMARACAKADLPWQAGYSARQTLRLNPALDLQALAIDRWPGASAGEALQRLGKLAAAEIAALHGRRAMPTAGPAMSPLAVST